MMQISYLELHMERVIALKGTVPILLIAPHGADDTNTAQITEMVAEKINAYTVINKGWQRSTKATDYLLDKANCNNVSHLHEDVVKEEFLDPILNYNTQILNNHESCFIFILHGMGEYVAKSNPDCNVVVGYGDSKNNLAQSASIKCKDSFNLTLKYNGFKVYQADRKSIFAGKTKNNLNQLFTQWYGDDFTQSIQIELISSLRKDKQFENTADHLAICFQDFLTYMSAENEYVDQYEYVGGITKSHPDYFVSGWKDLADKIPYSNV